MPDACRGGGEPGSATERPARAQAAAPSHDRAPAETAPATGGCGDPTCAAPEPDGDRAPVPLWRSPGVRWAGLAGLLWLTGAVMAGLPGDHPAALLPHAAAIVAGGRTFVPATLRALARGRLGVGTLMTIAMTGAVLLGEVGEAAMLAFLFSLAEALEDHAVAHTRHGLRALLSLVPPRATVLRPDGSTAEVAPARLAAGDVLLVRAGERLATDGVVRAGHSTLDTSAVTGESLPVDVAPGSEVFAGSVNGGGVLEVDVTAGVADNSLARVVRLVEQAQERKGAGQRLAARVARPLVPGVLVVAAGIAGIGAVLGEPVVWLERALVVLVAASPCAFAISVPVTVVAAIGAATRSGVLIKGGAALEALGTVRTVALDKTGTLTRNAPEVVAVEPAAGHTRERVLHYAAALEARSEHPLARAILAEVGRPVAATGVAAVSGSGLTGELDGARLRVGRPGFVAPGPLATAVHRMQEQGATAILVEADGEPVGAVAIRDELRPEAADAVAGLHRDGLRTAMLTGDNARAARHLARAAGITQVHAELLPEDKAALVRRLGEGGPVAMVGDGVNDAPALATAHVGVAMGAMGTDVAMETADVALMGEDLTHLPRALGHARRARRIMLQNLALSGGILLVLVPLAAVGTLGLGAVILTHEVAEVVVIANGLRAGLPPLRSRSGVPRSGRTEAAHGRPALSELAGMLRHDLPRTGPGSLSRPRSRRVEQQGE
ncbi:heavy metal translocating P-type ATPase [Marinactinospora rubrisoli]|uniref:Heavy metal translocating P-type ATPase n=1 Tax=Marinactinospora rubrisoli TaxID=2715399 RepID=A0ABW2KKL7_9ACTN